MRIDIWSDIVCPWCLIGKRRLESALVDFEHRDDVEVVYHSFELDPTAPAVATETSSESLARKYGADQVPAMQERVTELAAAEGLRYRLDQTPRVGTRLAHRVVHLALSESVALQASLVDALMLAYFERAENVGDPAVLRRIAVEQGLDASAVDRVLSSDEFEDALDADVRQAKAYGANGVPFFVVDERYGISGAQPKELFTQALEQAWSERVPKVTTLGGDAGVCGPDACAL